MKFSSLFLSALCVSSLVMAEDTKTLAEQAQFNETLNSPKDTAFYGTVGLGIVGIGYWMTKYCKDLWKKDILPEQFSWINNDSLGATVIKGAAASVLFDVTMHGVTKLISNKFGASTNGAGKSSNVWIEKAKSLGTACAFWYMGYEIAKGTKLPTFAYTKVTDGVKAIKDRFVGAKN